MFISIVKNIQRNNIYYRFVGRKENICSKLTTLLTYVDAKLWGIYIGKGSLFIGIPFLCKFPKSSIIIGARCRMRSSSRQRAQAGIMRPCTIETLAENSKIIIGDHCGFSGAMISAAKHIEIGSRSLCGANVSITDTDWHCVDPKSRNLPGVALPVKIGSNVWLGMNVIVLKGVTIGDNTVVAAGSIVSRDLPPNVLAVGQPASPIRDLQVEMVG